MPHNLTHKTDLSAVQLYPLGDAAIVVQFGTAIAPEVHECVRRFAAYLERHPFIGLEEYVPAYTTVTVYYNPWVISGQGEFNPYEKAVEAVKNMLPHFRKGAGKATPRTVEIPVCYGDSFGPDLVHVAELNNLSPAEVIALHTRPKYQVYMIGFAPGFPYLGGMSRKIAAPRQATPRAAIPAGSVGIAGEQTGIYPIETPGGWQLIGRTPLALFNPGANPPGLLQAGDVVKFVSISADEFEERKEQAHGA